jgi:hypothetical protein
VSKVLKIEDFQALLASEDSSLMIALRKLTEIVQLESIVAAIVDTEQPWTSD